MTSDDVTPLDKSVVLGSVWIPVDHSYLPSVGGLRITAQGPYAFWYSNIGTEQKFTNAYVSVNRGKLSLTRQNINGDPIFYLKEFQVPNGWPGEVSLVVVSNHHSFVVGWLDYNCNKPILNYICNVNMWAGNHIVVAVVDDKIVITASASPEWKLTISYENGKYSCSCGSRKSRT